jgi:endonuclease III
MPQSQAAAPGSSGAGRDDIVRVLLDQLVQTYAEQAGIRLANQPAPLYQLLVLVTLLSARISADVGVAGTRELLAAGYRTPRAMAAASWDDRVSALDRGHYVRYDYRAAERLGQGAALVTERYRGDLRRLRAAAGGQPARIAALLTDFPGIGPAGADIFLREVQVVWPDVAPRLDQKVLDGARKLGLPAQPAALARLSAPGPDVARLAAALVRVSRRGPAAAQVLAAAGQPPA